MIKNIKRLSLLLSFTILFMSLSSSVFASSPVIINETGDKILSQKYSNPDKNDGVYLIENLEIDGELYTFTHSTEDDMRIIEMSGAETGTFKAPIENDGNLENVSFRIRSSSTWYKISEERDYFYGAANIGRAALAAGIANLAGGPVGAFIAAASVIIGAVGGYQFSLVVYTGGRYKIEGTHIRFEMYSNIYYDSGKVKTVNWNGTR